MAGRASKQAKQLQRADKLCWTCEKKVQAERSRTPWSVADLLMVALTAGLWVPLRMMYHAVASPWRCAECRGRIEAWHKSLGQAAGYGFGGFVAVWLVVPGFIAVISDQPSGSNAAERSAEAIAKEKARREAATSEFQTNRAQIVSEIRSFISAGSYDKAAKQAEPYLFLKDAEVNELHGHAQKKAKESRLLASVERAPETDIDRRAKVYGELARLDPSNSAYQRKHAHYAGKVEARNKKAAAAKAAADRKAAAERAAREKKLAAEKAKRDAVVAKFGESPTQSAWDGSYYEVERYLKHVANDPDSIDIDACTKVYRADDGWLVGCDYRGRNAFGGMIRKSNWFTIRHGRVVAMHDASRYRP